MHCELHINLQLSNSNIFLDRGTYGIFLRKNSIAWQKPISVYISEMHVIIVQFLGLNLRRISRENFGASATKYVCALGIECMMSKQ